MALKVPQKRFAAVGKYGTELYTAKDIDDLLSRFGEGFYHDKINRIEELVVSETWVPPKKVIWTKKGVK